ncbi:2-hydroxyacid dehydrogenase [Ferrimicrobium sp.]|uniref:2-hydroxyacid dehydrogenase n=1 Tax=Ferrimicrobium sp. TaxID=2926050 RepID=UPI00260DFD12|nr:2-hydroxyacid dehydrogenase [Ferrimicrobium sp.]
MQITVPERFSLLVDRFPGLPIVVQQPDQPWDERLAATTFFIPDYMSGRAGVANLSRMPKVEVVQILSAGVDSVKDLIPDGVTLCNAKGVHDAATAEMAITLTLASLRGLGHFRDLQHDRHWDNRSYASLADRRVLLIGYGSIGTAIEARLSGFEVQITRVARVGRVTPRVFGYDELDELIPDADVIIVIVPLTQQTRGMIDAHFLSLMHDGALLVNVARGPVVDTDALVGALADRRIFAALDVTDPEPLPSDSPLWRLDNCLITPHVGGDTDAFYPRALELLTRNIERYRRGLPLLNVIKGEY